MSDFPELEDRFPEGDRHDPHNPVSRARYDLTDGDLELPTEPLPCHVCGAEGHRGTAHNRQLRRYE
jgi:hypothetical protein